MKTTPELGNAGTEKIVEGNIVPPSAEELLAKTREIERLRDSLARPPDVNLDDFSRFKEGARIAEAKVKIRNGVDTIITGTPGVAGALNSNNQAFGETVPNRYDWKGVSDNEEAVRIVRNSMDIEEAALSTDPKIIIPEGHKPRGQSGVSLDERTEGSLRETLNGEKQNKFIFLPEENESVSGSSESGEAVFANIADKISAYGNTQEEKVGALDFVEYPKESHAAIGQEYIDAIAESNAKIGDVGPADAKNGIGSEIKVNNFSASEQEKAKEVWLKNNPGSEVTSNNFSDREQEIAVETWLKNNPNAPLDIDLDKIETDAKNGIGSEIKVNNFSASEQEKAKEEWLKNNPGSEVTSNNFTAKEQEEAKAKWMKDNPGGDKKEDEVFMRRSREDFLKMSERSLEGVKKSMNVLEARKKGVAGRLLEKGLTGLVGGLEAFGKVSPRKKAVIGLMFAGASVATGGMTSVLSKGLSTLSFASSHYNEKLKANEASGIETDKRKLAVQSLTRGLILALATSYLISEVTKHVDMSAVIDSAAEKVSVLKDGVREWITGLTNSVDTGTALTPGGGDLIVPAGNSLTPSESIVTPDATPGIPPLSDYIIKPGDNLTKIIREQIIPTIPGTENFTPFQINNMIENYLKESAKYKGLPFFDQINQFLNPNVIQPDVSLDLEKMREGMMSFTYPNLGNINLVDNAKSLIGSQVSQVVSSSAGVSYLPSTVAPDVGIPTSAVGSLDLGASSSGGNGQETPRQIFSGEEPVEGNPRSGNKYPYENGGSGDNPRIEGLGYRNNA